MSQQQAEWQQKYQKLVKDHPCKNCGSKKITLALNGYPYEPYVQFHQQLTQKLGYKTLALFGCMGKARPFCSQCKAVNFQASKEGVDGEAQFNYQSQI